ncbi:MULTISPECIES: aspartyl/asparaginyl beta-hydroxylase domain-containing protein [Sphingomonas]|uniref:Aspartyl/asparaginyl beta-hydroxylase domain-containing protein n=1 Tax=Sphingomonas molluscorum TaxID=418184 RepID=A0ABU8QAQ7_9SPHN|nr:MULTISPECIES: aspartyl/asparaginyl beta-hydroxylase domain-containing protein [unclassified Sphingomonas]MBM7408194.1 beta-hydroxylase [Sphingomonas sp. JUb134]MCG7349948.1 aspartyl/asparaginyl beta-hydroxylase domain-containing protein [Sphingomonas sp. ACRSK]RSV11542.1 aspartyl/asparaginyl beta-hydroxylase domain-containing protein [Sphingomonas sp. ABOLF]
MPKRPITLRLGKKLRPIVNAIVTRGSLVGNGPVHDPADFPWVHLLRSEWRNIAHEATIVCAHREAVPPLNAISPDHARIAADGLWRSFFLVGYGQSIEENRRRCPATSRLIGAVPGLNSAFFSILAPGAHIPRHKGVTKGLLTCHIGLAVPGRQDGCRMLVASETLHWADGQALVFDDTYPHEIWNDTDEVRIVLLLQFRRPMARVAGWIADLFLSLIRRSAFVRDARRDLARWQELFRAAEDNNAC